MRTTACPICRKPRKEFELPMKYLPFCSVRCKNIDLAKWLGEDYQLSQPLSENDEFELDDEEGSSNE